jgi:transposase-like protein
MPINPHNPFKGRQFSGEVIVLCVRWYLRYPLSYEHVTELLAERGVEVDASSIWRWVQAYAPELNKRCRPYLKPTNKSYRIDETYINVKGEDKYLYRALDSTGQTIDFLLTAKRDTAAAKRFLRRAIEASGNPMPRVMNVDKNPADPAAVEALKADGAIPRRVTLRQCKYLNNVIEQDHRTVKKTSMAGQGLWILSECVADVTRYRDRKHDPEGASEMAGQRRCGRPSALHRQAIRTLCVTQIHA